MPNLRLALVFVVLLLAVLSLRAPAASNAQATLSAPAHQSLGQVAPTPAPSGTQQPIAPIGEGTQQVLLILGLAALIVLLIGGGIYLRRRWIATRY
jgi:hypothetical protein